jgi:hypothetical protein
VRLGGFFAVSQRSIVGKNGIGSMLTACLGPPQKLLPPDSEQQQALNAQVQALKARILQLEAELSRAKAYARSISPAPATKQHSARVLIDVQCDRAALVVDS